jgi:site-specific DNA-methyltransferase (adenine-specific)
VVIRRREIIGDCELLLGDCLEILPTLGPVDAVVTDPPYDAKTHKGARYGFRATSSEIPFSPIEPAAIVPALLAVSKGWVLAFCALEAYGDYKAAAMDCWVRAGFWRRVNGVPQFTGDRPGQPGEGIAIMHSGRTKKQWNGNGHHAFWESPIVSGGPHPTTKPVDLMGRLVRLFTNAGETVADPFMGSGTTLVACAKLGRRGIGIEIDEGYFNIACERVRKAYAQPDLFIAPPAAPVQEPLL